MGFSARPCEALASSVPVFASLSPALQCQAVHREPSRDMVSGRWLKTLAYAFQVSAIRKQCLGTLGSL